MTMQSVTFRIQSNKVAKLDRLGETTERDRTFHINKAIDMYLAKKGLSSNGDGDATPAPTTEKKTKAGAR